MSVVTPFLSMENNNARLAVETGFSFNAVYGVLKDRDRDVFGFGRVEADTE